MSDYQSGSCSATLFGACVVGLVDQLYSPQLLEPLRDKTYPGRPRVLEFMMFSRVTFWFHTDVLLVSIGFRWFVLEVALCGSFKGALQGSSERALRILERSLPGSSMEV